MLKEVARGWGKIREKQIKSATQRVLRDFELSGRKEEGLDSNKEEGIIEKLFQLESYDV